MAIEVPPWLALWAQGELEVDDRTVAILRLPSGRVVACDPVAGRRKAGPFAREVPPGDYPVLLGRAEGDIVLACLRLAEAPVARWEVALCPGDEPGEDPPGYDVESGMGCFADAEAAARAEVLGDGVVDAIQRHGFTTVSAEPGFEGSLVAFTSGAGDGIYASWWGLDGQGRPVCLVTDFGLVEVDEAALDDDPLLDDDGPLGEEQLRGLLAELAGEAPEEDGDEAAPRPVSPVFLRVRTLVDRWEERGRLELAEGCDREALAEALLEALAKLEGHRRVGAHLAEWLIERPEVVDLFASDADLEADLSE